MRLRNEGFLSGVARCRFPKLPPMVGYAATARIRTASAPMSHRCYYDRMDWWSYVASLPEPRVMVLQDADHNPGLGAFVGEIHAAIGVALKCVGCVTNGAVRDLPAVEAMGFQMFANHTSVSHAYAHITEFGEPVEIGQFEDCIGRFTAWGSPRSCEHSACRSRRKFPTVASRILEEERELVQFCHSPQFSLRELSERIRKMNVSCDSPWRDGQ